MILQVENVSKKFYRDTVLSDVSFSVEKGEVVGFVGANGAGKTTTIGTILGFISSDTGSICLFDTVLSQRNMKSLHGRIGYAAGDMEMPPKLTGKQYLAFAAAQFGSHDMTKLDSLKRCFDPQLDKEIGKLSRGNKQKIALIAAFMASPELVILDEPTSGLDPVMQEVFLSLVRQEQKNGTTIFMSSHYLNEVADVCTRVILMRHGRIIRDISSEELLRQSGKFVAIVSRNNKILPPPHAADVSRSTKDGLATLSFVHHGSAYAIQHWLANVDKIEDVEISEYNLEGAFKEMYASEEAII